MDIKEFSQEELNSFSKDMLIALYQQAASCLSLLKRQEEEIIGQNRELLEQNRELSKQIMNLQESMAVLINHRFGRKTEKTADMINGQIFMDAQGNLLVLNEAEETADSFPEEEKSEEELLREAKEREEKKKRKPGKRQEDFGLADVVVDEYEMTKEELAGLFPEGYKELPCKVSHRVEYEPAKVVVHEEHIHQYKSIKSDTFVSADHPAHLLPHSIVTPSLAAKILYDKYVNAIPINRISKELGWLDVVVRPPTMCRWVVSLAQRYFPPILEGMREQIKKADLIHCDETPFICVEDREKKGSKTASSYMWVYHSADGARPVFLYEYKDNRRTENIEAFLSGYRGVIMADGYEPYHIAAKKSGGAFVVAGCWAHAKRKFAEVVKADPKNAVGTVAMEGNNRIAAIYHVDNMAKGKSPEERLKHRQENVRPLVDDLFKWAKERVNGTGTKKTRDALQYALNQEPYLRMFLDNGMVPLDNSDAERSIRSFCVGKHSWHIASTSSGAQASGMFYSIAETAKANGLKPYEYFRYLLEQMLLHENSVTDDLVRSLLPWSETLPEEIRAKK